MTHRSSLRSRRPSSSAPALLTRRAIDRASAAINDQGDGVAVWVFTEAMTGATSAWATPAPAAAQVYVANRDSNTVSVIDYGQTEDGLLYLVMEFLRGPTLTHVLRTETLPAGRASNGSTSRAALSASRSSRRSGATQRKRSSRCASGRNTPTARRAPSPGDAQ